MASEQTNAKEAIAQAVAEANRTKIQAMAVAEAERTHNVGPRPGGPIMTQPLSNWKAGRQVQWTQKLQARGKIIFKSYNKPQAEQMDIIKNRLGRKGLHFLESLTWVEQEGWNTTEGLFTTLNNKFKPQYNEAIKSFQYHKLSRQMNKNAEEWMGRHRLSVV